jgi:hypothetical protein
MGLLLEKAFAGFLVGAGCGLILCLPSFVINFFRSIAQLRERDSGKALDNALGLGCFKL